MLRVKKKDLIDAGLPDDSCNCVIEDKIIEHSRWAVLHLVIFNWEGKVYSASYRIGATELQDESPWEYDDFVELTEMRRVRRTEYVWIPTKDG